MFQRIIPILSFVVSIYFVYKYRYRVVNAFLGKPWLRKIAVSLAIQVPFIRDKMLGTALPFNRPQNV